jgi:hypothetical protein
VPNRIPCSSPSVSVATCKPLQKLLELVQGEVKGKEAKVLGESLGGRVGRLQGGY